MALPHFLPLPAWMSPEALAQCDADVAPMELDKDELIFNDQALLEEEKKVGELNMNVTTRRSLQNANDASALYNAMVHPHPHTIMSTRVPPSLIFWRSCCSIYFLVFKRLCLLPQIHPLHPLGIRTTLWYPLLQKFSWSLLTTPLRVRQV